MDRIGLLVERQGMHRARLTLLQVKRTEQVTQRLRHFEFDPVAARTQETVQRHGKRRPETCSGLAAVDPDLDRIHPLGAEPQFPDAGDGFSCFSF
ncbi:hypothetical protein SDC9_176993 [bioreactor metagenome]|uniref:Uncharacterized protein n=1 Tax=bioreactor metagenome TaxID=1076179 RepID=A0A645GTC2_9ZZZZ